MNDGDLKKQITNHLHHLNIIKFNPLTAGFFYGWAPCGATRSQRVNIQSPTSINNETTI